jgi:hypothetical protein
VEVEGGEKEVEKGEKEVEKGEKEVEVGGEGGGRRTKLFHSLNDNWPSLLTSACCSKAVIVDFVLELGNCSEHCFMVANVSKEVDFLSSLSHSASVLAEISRIEEIDRQDSFMSSTREKRM